jgi:AcrR family transcriptional regulator
MWAMSTSEEKNCAGPYHHGDLRAALVAAAIELVSSSGPAAVSLREVARMVGVSHNAPYRHFPTRQALLAAVAARGFEMVRQEMRARTEGVDPADYLQVFGHGYIAFALQNRGIYQLMFSDEIRKDEHPELGVIAGQAFEALQQHVVALHPNVDSGAAAVTVWALLHGISHLILDNQIKPDAMNDPLHTTLVGIATRILIAGLVNVPADGAPLGQSVVCPAFPGP